MRWASALAVSLAMSCRPAPTAAPDAGAAPAAPAIDEAALARGELPGSGPEVDLLRSRCAICHGLDYVTQQRLTPGQWEKTVAKMRRWGAPLDEAEAARLVSYAAARWTTELPERPHLAVGAPAGATGSDDESR